MSCLSLHKRASTTQQGVANILILSRRFEESIVLWTDDGMIVSVTVLPGHGGQVRLAIDAPKHVHIDRNEIYTKKMLEKATS